MHAVASKVNLTVQGLGGGVQWPCDLAASWHPKCKHMPTCCDHGACWGLVCPWPVAPLMIDLGAYDLMGNLVQGSKLQSKTMR
jgi:hypothetical protein